MDIAGSIHLLESTGWDLEVGIKSNDFDVKKWFSKFFKLIQAAIHLSLDGHESDTKVLNHNFPEAPPEIVAG